MPFFEEIAQLIKDAANYLGSNFDSSVDMFQGLWNSIVSVLKSFWDQFKGFFENLFIQ